MPCRNRHISQWVSRRPMKSCSPFTTSWPTLPFVDHLRSFLLGLGLPLPFEMYPRSSIAYPFEPRIGASTTGEPATPRQRTLTGDGHPCQVALDGRDLGPQGLHLGLWGHNVASVGAAIGTLAVPGRAATITTSGAVTIATRHNTPPYPSFVLSSLSLNVLSFKIILLIALQNTGSYGCAGHFPEHDSHR